MMIAIIDSGINMRVFNSYDINQYCIHEGIVTEEVVEDSGGHGTSMLGIILRRKNEITAIVSLRPVICGGVLHNKDIAIAIRFAVDKGAKIISISMGTDLLKDRGYIEDACEYAYRKGILVVCAFSKRNDVILPWACKYVLKVMHEDERKQSIQLKRTYFDSYMLCVSRPMYRTVDVTGASKMIVGHSAATAYITSEIIYYMKKYLCNSINALRLLFLDYGIQYMEKKLYNKIETIKGKVPYLDKKNNIEWGAAAVIPYSKEMESLINFKDFGSYCIKVGVDYSKKGIRERTKQINGLPIETSLEQLKKYDLNTIIIGYLDRLECYSEVWSMNYILQFALMQNYNVFSFLPVPEDIRIQFTEKKLILREAKVYDNIYFKQIKEIVPYSLHCKLPVLGVFGTSSKQGKFTLQMLIRRELNYRCIKHVSLLTEHQAELLDTSICFPIGYKGEKNIQINIEAWIGVIQKSLYYLEQTTDAEMVLAGGQSWLIPHNIDRQIAIYNLAFLEAIRPDFSVVVVNPEIDSMEYICDTIKSLQVIYKIQTIGIAFSDEKVVLRGRAVLRRPRDDQNKVEISNYLQQGTGIYAGCITDYDFINEIVNIFITKTS